MHSLRHFPAYLRQYTGRRYARNVLVAAMGFAAAGALGMLLAVLLLKNPLTGWIMSWVDETQPLQRLVLGLILFLVSMAISGAVVGGLSGWVLTLVDSLAPRRRYVLTGAVAFAVPQAIFVPLGLILASVLGIYFNNLDADPLHLPILFGMFGLFYGMVAGLIFGLASVGFKYGWGVLFASMIGGLMGGLLTGEALRWVLARMGMGVLLAHGWVAWLIFLIFYASLGVALGVVYTWFHRTRYAGGDLPRKMGRFWRIFGMFAVIMVLLNLAGVFYQVYAFAMMKPASTSPVIGPKALGTAWTPFQRLAPASSLAETPALAADAQGRLGLAWTLWDEDAHPVVSLSQGGVEDDGWARWDSTFHLDAWPSHHPDIASDGTGTWHVVWESQSGAGESTDAIMYMACRGETCDSMPVDLTFVPSRCLIQGTPASPTIAIDASGQIMVVWTHEGGPMSYLTWRVGDPLPPMRSCLPVTGRQPRLAPQGNAGFLLTWETDEGIHLARYRGGRWELPPMFQARGHDAMPRYDVDRAVMQVVWCGDDHLPHIWTSDPAVGEERLAGPDCMGRVLPLEDGQGRLHLVWESQQVANPWGFVHRGHVLYDSVREADGWTSPVLARASSKPMPFDAIADGLGGLQMVETSHGGSYASRPSYTCPDTTGSPYGDAILEVLRTDPYRPPDVSIPFCGNEFLGMYMLPERPPTSPVESSPNDAFTEVANQIRSARFEVDFATMEWMSDEQEDSPGFLLAQAVTDLYGQVLAHPDQYPRGVTVRILLGNYPELATFTWGDQVWHVMDVLQKAGLPTLEDPELGWKVEVANFDGQNPHSHAKFLVVDGEKVMAGGFNYSYLHFSRNHPSGQGVSLVDYGLLMRGPVAQDALAAYDDLWEGSNLVQCPDLHPPKGRWDRYCTIAAGAAIADHVPEVTLYHTTPDDAIAFSLLRTSHRPESDLALDALLRSAQQRIDIFEVNFSLEVYCALGILMDDFCSMQDALPYMQALLDVMEQRQVHIRVLTTDVNMNGIENSVAIETFRRELARRGLEHLAEFRYYDGRMHTKAFLVDDAFLVVGSQNFHYSAWGEDRGLVEYNLATNAPEAIQQFQDSFAYYWAHSRPVVPGQVRSD